MSLRDKLKDAKRVVIKVGTSTLLYGETGQINLNRIDLLVREIVDLSNQGKDVILVTSGAIGVGMVRMGLKKRPTDVKEKQALASVGQGLLMHLYDKFFAEYGKTMGQVLLTMDNAVQHKQYSNSRNTLMTMLKMGVIPVINENDAVAVDEVKIGDNDRLSAMVASLVDAELLIILSDIDGVYTANPSKDPNATIIDEIPEITPAVEKMAGGAGSDVGTGGMATKIEAAKIATASGVTMLIASGSENGIIRAIMDGESKGTIFPAKEAHLKVRKSWLAFGKRLKGVIRVDEGCERALKSGSSLLAAGITATEGNYEAGNTVRILSADGREIARGVMNYSAEAMDRIKGHSTKEFASLLNGEKIYDEAIHRDNLVLMI